MTSHFATQPAYGLGHFRADRPTTQYEQAPGYRLHAGHFAVASRHLPARPGPGRGDDRVGAGGQNDVAGAVWGTPSTSTTPTPASRPRPAEEVDTLVGQPSLLAGIGVVRDHEVAIGQGRLHIDLGARRRLARLLGCLARAEQSLGRDARPIGTFAADQLAFHDGDPQSTVGQLSGTVFSRRSAAQDDDVIVCSPAGLRSHLARTAGTARPP